MHRRPRNVKKTIATILAVAALMAMITVFTGMLIAKSSAATNAAYTKPNTSETVALAGKWTAAANQSTFVATVEAGTIQIMWVTGESSGLYWKGTFVESASEGDVITSVGDTEAMELSMLGSGSANKAFTYQHGALDFDMTITGITTRLHLKK